MPAARCCWFASRVQAHTPSEPPSPTHPAAFFFATNTRTWGVSGKNSFQKNPPPPRVGRKGRYCPHNWQNKTLLNKRLRYSAIHLPVPAVRKIGRQPRACTAHIHSQARARGKNNTDLGSRPCRDAGFTRKQKDIYITTHARRHSLTFGLHTCTHLGKTVMDIRNLLLVSP